MYELMIILLIGIDQIVKNWALNELKYKGAITVIENVFNLTYVENRGAAFGLFENNQMIFVVVALIAGALGNLIDRVRLDFVVDYFDFVFIWNYVFNLADCFIVVGTILLCIYVVLFDSNTKKQ